MTIQAGSRYANSTVVMARNLDDTADVQVILFSNPKDLTFSFTNHQVTADDQIDVLAYKFYADPTLWYIIANANPEVTDFMNLVPGSLLRIPSVPSVI